MSARSCMRSHSAVAVIVAGSTSSQRVRANTHTRARECTKGTTKEYTREKKTKTAYTYRIQWHRSQLLR